ncbi:MAG TPA: glycoside hydrolase family 125 protein [Longimicrobiales bacterium]
MAEVAAGAVDWEVTGNHYIAIPAISPRDGGIHRLNVLHRGALGLLEWAAERAPGAETGGGVLVPEVREDGRVLEPHGLAWERLDRWIPRFRAEVEPGLEVRGTLCAPGGGELLLPGAVYTLEVENRTGRDRTLEVGLAGTWRWSLRTIETSRPLTAANRVVVGAGGRGLVLEMGGEPGLAALAVTASGGAVRCEAAPAEPAEPGIGRMGGGEVEVPNGRPVCVRIARTLTVAAGKRAAASFFLAVAVERDGALARAESLRRIGAAELLRLGRLHLSQMVRPIRDAALAGPFNRNLLFNVFYAVGRAVDDDRLYPLVSRSPLCGTTAVFRERDALLWSLPALQLADPATAREALLRAFEQYSHRPGARGHYLDGTVLAPEFVLAHFCAYAVALDRYIEATQDEGVLEEPIVAQVLEELDDLLLDRLHPEVMLASTEALASGEPAAHPYVTYDNALVRALCVALGRYGGAAEGERGARNFGGAAEEVESAIWQHCTAEIDGLRVLAWSTDLAGEAAVYDDPEASLALLPELGFCDADDPIWLNTMELLRSDRNPLWLGDREHPGLASRRHPGWVSLAGTCADLLGPRRDEARARLAALRLDGGLACGWYDPDTGAPVAERHHAALAGFLAWTIWRALAA